MSDLIERQAAIDAICKSCSTEGDYHKCDGYPETSTWCDELVALRALPSARPEQKWIPVSEGLPKKDGRYQVTRHDDVTNTEFIDILWYEKNIWWNRQATGDYAVTAWMPLPEPYRAERREDG